MELANIFLIQKMTDCMRILIRDDMIGKLNKLVNTEEISNKDLEDVVDGFDMMVFGKKLTDQETVEKIKCLFNNN